MHKTKIFIITTYVTVLIILRTELIEAHNVTAANEHSVPSGTIQIRFNVKISINYKLYFPP